MLRSSMFMTRSADVGMSATASLTYLREFILTSNFNWSTLDIEVKALQVGDLRNVGSERVILSF